MTNLAYKFEFENELQEGEFVCPHCGKTYDEEDSVCIDGEWYCCDCTVYCDNCGEYVLSDDSHFDGDICVCQDCMDDYYVVDVDDTIQLREECVYISSMGGFVLESSNEVVQLNDGSYELLDNLTHIYKYHSGTDGDVDWKFVGNPTNGKYLGIEIECNDVNQGYDPSGDVDIAHHCEWDSSVDGYEIVVHPHGVEELLDQDWEYLFDRLQDNGWRETKGTGVHIHVSRDFFIGRREIGHVCRFFSENFETLLPLVNRDSYNAKRWANAIPKEYWYDEDCYFDRYHCVNLCNDNTIEIRLFGSTTNPALFRAYVELVDVVTELSNQYGFVLTLEKILEVADEKGYTELVEFVNAMQ